MYELEPSNNGAVDAELLSVPVLSGLFLFLFSAVSSTTVAFESPKAAFEFQRIIKIIYRIQYIYICTFINVINRELISVTKSYILRFKYVSARINKTLKSRENANSAPTQIQYQ